MRKSIFLLLTCWMVSLVSYGQFGSKDATFNSTDVGFGSGLGPSNDVEVVKIQSDGKILVGGSFIQYNGSAASRIARLQADGRLDTDFNLGSGFNGTVHDMVLQGDGKIIVVGDFTSFNGTSRSRIARLNANGTLDTGFSPSISFSDVILSVALQSDGKMVVGGFFSDTGINHIARLNADGTLDTGFTIGTGFNDFVYSVVIQNDDKILVGGLFSSFNATVCGGIARLNANGTLDAGFSTGSGFNGILYDIVLQSNGQIIAGGGFSSFNGTLRNCIARLNGDGSLDTGFNPGTGFTGLAVFTLALQTDGKIIAGGSFSQFNSVFSNNIVRLNTNGSRDADFQLSVISNDINAGFDDWVRGVILRADGKVLVGGRFEAYTNTGVTRIALLNSGGSIDNTFNPRTGFNSQPNAIVVQADGKFIVGGTFTTYNGIPCNRIVRINADGSLDASFNPFNGFNGDVLALALQSDGRVVVGGNFTSFNGTTRNNIARLNANGSLDTGFNPGTGFGGLVYALAIQSDGKIVVGGSFPNFNGITRNNIARLNANGSLDADFNPGTGFDNVVQALALQADGKVIVGGGFGNFNANSRNRIARLNANGSLDTDFNPGTGFGSIVYALAIQSDGKVIVGGSFGTFNGTSDVNRIARLNANGSLDTDFTSNAGFGFNQAVYALSLYPDGKIIAGGEFTVFGGTNRARIAVLNAAGSLDMSFNPGAGFNELVGGLVQQADGKIVVVGGFTAFNSLGANYITRLNGVVRTITATGTLADLNTIYGTASVASSFNLSGSNMSTGITVAPAGATANFFEVSLTESSGYANSIVVGAAGNIAVTTVYVRLKANAPMGSYGLGVQLSSLGANNVVVSGANNNVTRKALSLSGITANNKIYDGATSTTLSGTPVLAGIVGSDLVSVSGTPSANFDNANVGSGKPVTIIGYTLAGIAAGNYSLTQPIGLAADITERSLSIAGLTANNKAFDGSTAAVLSGMASLVGVVSGDNVLLAGAPTAAFDTPDIGNNKTVTVTGFSLAGSAAGNYMLTMPLLLSANITEFPTSLSELSDLSVSIYPNPASLKVFIKLPRVAEEISIRVLNSQGQVIETLHYGSQNLDILDVSLEKMNKGVFFIEITHRGASIIKRVVRI